MKYNSTLLLTFCFFFLLSLTLSAQRPGGPDGPRGGKGMLRGKVIDGETEEPLSYATISLFSQKDSAVVAGNITDDLGAFEIEIPRGKLYAKIEFIGYQATYLNEVRLAKGERTLDLGVIKLGVNSALLEEVEVIAEKSTVQMSLDKRVFNVGKDLANTGGNAADILDNVPSVAVDIEGNVSLRGSEGVQILVDGKPSGLVGISGSGGLRNLPANLIEKVEVITNPSAKFEAEGAAGIINIVLRKEQKAGLNGSFDFTVGDPSIYGASINLNYRKDNFNFFTNLGVNHRKNIGGGSSYQEFYRGSITEIVETERTHERGGLSGSLRFGADYYFNPKNILTTSFLYRIGDEGNLAELRYGDFLNSLDNPIRNSFRTDEEVEEESKLEYAITYKKLFKKKGHQLEADLRFQDNTEKESSEFIERYFLADNTIPSGPNDLQRSANTEGERRLIAKLDYTLPLRGKNEKFETGFQGSFRDIKNDFIVEEYEAEEWSVYDGLSNNFRYEENIYAVYATYGNKINKFSYQLGARLEYSDVTTELLQTNEVNPREYLNFFPSVHLTYDLPKSNAIQVSYSRRLKRPRFWFLNPFFTLSDNRNRFTGNPNLDPEFTDSYEIGHVKYWSKGSLGSAIFYRHTTGVMQRIIFDVQEIDSLIVSFRRPENLATQDDIGIEFNFSYDPFKWWKLSGDVNFFRSITDGSNINSTFTADTYTMRGRMTSRTTILETDVQLRFNYRAPRETTQGRRESMSSLDVGISRDVFKKKGTLTLSVSDLFQTRRRRGTTITDTLFKEEDFQWRGRTARLTLNYRLNQKKKRGGGRGERGGGDGGDF
ncbi:MAG: TonB-dependent receptor [Saprospiraceae bacterium]